MLLHVRRTVAMPTRQLMIRSLWRNSNSLTLQQKLISSSKSSTGGDNNFRKGLPVEMVADRVGVRLTTNELASLRQKLDFNRDGLLSRAEVIHAGSLALEERSTRELCLSVIEKPTSALDKLGAHAVTFCDYGGTALFAVVGTQIAGDAGMNVVGCALVGCIAAIGGGTLNNALYGASSPLHGRPGVFWVRVPSYLVVALGASVLTFFAWPAYCSSTVEHYLKDVIGEENLEKDSTVERQDQGNDPGHLFHHIDTHFSGTIDRLELQALVQHNFDNSFETFALDTLALAGFAVAAVHGAIGMGIHPIVAATSGVTICFGGILRDVLCGRDLAFGAQSYAFATGAGSTLYVLLRELTLRGIRIPLIGRIFLSAGTTIALRVWEYVRGEPLLAPMHGRKQLPLRSECPPQDILAKP